MAWIPLTEATTGVVGELLNQWNAVLNNLNFVYNTYVAGTGLVARVFASNEIAVGADDGLLTGLVLNRGSLAVGGETAIEEFPIGEPGQIISADSNGDLEYVEFLNIQHWRLLIGV